MQTVKLIHWLFFASITLYCPFIFSQSDSIAVQTVPEVIVKASKINTEISVLPLSVSVCQATVLQQSRQQLSLQEYISEVPGLFSLNANNYAQDLRIAMRGFGARAAFGIRGIALIVDGIPETTPDGQGQLDNLNLGIIEKIEVIRGPSSSLYGNASGGVISIETISQPDSSFLEAGLTFGAFQMQQYQLLAAFKDTKTSYVLQGSYTANVGYREHSHYKTFNVNLRSTHRFSDQAKASLLINFAKSPTAEDPGGISAEALDIDRKQARDANIDFQAGEAVDQLKISLRFQKQFSSALRFETYGFGSGRNFSGRLPFEFGGWVDLRRSYFGQGASLQAKQIFSGAVNELRLGYALAYQNDERQRFENLNGKKGLPTLRQDEIFRTAGLYLLDQLQIEKWLLNLGLRADWNRLEAQDQFLSNGDDSGEIRLFALNPSIGLSYRLPGQGHLYANFSTSFETPSLSELSANPLSAEGFNETLKPQKAKNYEIGFKSQVSDLQWQLAFFHIRTSDELVPYELEAFPGRDFFRNAGSTRRNGLEAMAQLPICDHWRFAATYTFSNFTYSEFRTPEKNLKNKWLPGIPRHMGSLSVAYLRPEGFHAKLLARLVGKLYADDENTVSDQSYLLMNAQLGYRKQGKTISYTPFLGINNLLDQSYNDNIRINAFGGRYYEAAPGIHLFGGLRVRF